jgi:hypothetical protein
VARFLRPTPAAICCIAVLISSCEKKPKTTARQHWTVTVGAETREELADGLRKSTLSEQNEAESFILLARDSPDFKISPRKEELDLVVLTAEELKLPTAQSGPELPFDDFKAKLAAAGYQLCPHDAVAKLLLAIRGFEPLEFTYVATEQIMGMREKRLVMRPLDLAPEAPRRYIAVRPRKG